MSKNFRSGMTAIALALSLGSAVAYAAPCDFSFTAIPTFANMCVAGVPLGIYTIKNNSPVSLKINYIRIKNNDALPTAAAIITAAPTNNCGASLAAGASCNIQLGLLPLSLGQFNRVLQIGINSRQYELAAPAITAAVNCPAAAAPTAPTGTLPGGGVSPFPAGSDFTFSILGASTVTNTGPTAITGDVGVSPGSAITGFPPGTVTGTIHAADATAALAQSNLTTTYNNLAGKPCGTNLTGQNLATVGPLAPGVYCFNTSADLAVGGALVLKGAGQYVFQIGSTLTANTGSSVSLTDGASKDNVFWQVGSSATIGVGSVFYGVIVAQTSITLNTSAVLNGRALARTGAVTLDTNIVTP
jgi:hypothetical protein